MFVASKIEVPRIFEVRKQDKFKRDYLNSIENASPKMRQDHVSGRVSVLCWLAAPVAMFYRNLPEYGNKVKVGNKV